MAPGPAQEDEPVVEESLARGRSRRTKTDKTGRFAALERLKKVKESGEKHKYEFADEAAVYEEVDETEYSKIVRERQEDDWIVDDDGSGYVEDGREIFDDELDEDNAYTSKAKKAVEQSRKGKNPNIMKPGGKPKATIKSMFRAHTGLKKKPEKEVSLDNDDILGDIMNELNQNSSAPAFKPPAAKMAKQQNGPAKAPYNPFSTKVKPRSSPAQPVKSNFSPSVPQRTTPKPSLARKIKREIKQEVEESPEIEEYDSIPMDVGNDNDDDGRENVEVKKEPKVNGYQDSAMDVGDIDFDDQFEVEKDQKPEVKEERKSKPVISTEFMASSWDSMQGGNDKGSAMTDVNVDSSSLPLTTNENGDQVLRMFWLDAYEERIKAGTIFLFGKVWIESAKTHVSCCVCVSNIERQMFFLPRATRVNVKTGNDTGEEVTFVDVYNEITKELKDKRDITTFKSRKVTKEYCFEVADVPVESEYMEVRYNGARFPTKLPQDLKGETFSHVFGTNTSFLELLLLERKLKGPCWIDIKTPNIMKAPISWCKVEAEAVSPDCITVLKDAAPPPPLVSMTITMRTLPNPKTHQNEVIAVACLVQQQFHMDKPAPQTPFNYHFCAITKPSDNIFPYDFKDHAQSESKNTKVEIQPNERALLGFLLARIHKIDPDLIVGHDIYGFDIDVLLHRLQNNKIAHWSKLGRLKRSMMPKLTGGGRGFSIASQTAMCGRIVCDVKVSAKELIRSRAYDLTELSNQVLKEKRQEVDVDEIRNMYSSSKQLMELVKLTLIDATLILRMMYELNVLPLALQITNICGNVMSRTLMGGRAERNEHLLLHAFTEKNYIAPDKQYGKKIVEENADEGEANESGSGKKSQGRRKPAYAGGLVLEPKKGFYDQYILLLDFNSLYPSIIQEYNICFTTIARNSDKTKQEGEEVEDWHLELPDSELEPGILPTEIRKLVESRKQVKHMMKAPNLSSEAYMQYDIRQKALKLTANSMYGCLGFSHSRFYAKPLAALVTGKGREILMKTKDLVETMNLEVIYGDTDSIMINTNSTDMEQVFKLGNKVKSEVNKLYRLLEIDIDGVFKSMLLLKKKKYAALTVSKVGDKYVTSQELKGLDIVRRDWCELAKSAGNFVVSQILSGENRETIVENIHSKLIEVGEEVGQGKVPPEMFFITKQLTKNPTDYPDKKSLAHVQVALRLNSKGGRQLKSGDTVYYVICEDGSNLPASQRAYHPDELSKSETLKIDNKYYLSSQVHPVVSRLCDPIEGTDAAHIAECLGLDPTGYKHAIRRSEDHDEDAMLSLGMSEAEKYKDCEPLKVSCPSCEREILFDSVFRVMEPVFECALSKCPNPQCTNTPSSFVPLIQNRLVLAIRGHLQSYYQGWMKCEDSACNARTRRLPLVFQRGHPICQACRRGILHPEYTDTALYHQLCYYRYMFDLNKAIQDIPSKHRGLASKFSDPYAGSYNILKTFVDKKLRESAYSQVNLATLFDGLGLVGLK